MDYYKFFLHENLGKPEANSHNRTRVGQVHWKILLKICHMGDENKF